VSKRPQITFFTDWCIGKTVPEALRSAGARVEVHGDHFAPETPDIEWLREVSQRGWAVLTKDKAISKNQLELMAIAEARAKVFMFASGNLSRAEMSLICVNAVEQMEKFAIGNPAPFIAKIYKSSKVSLWKNKTQLLKLLSAK
jgi:predicted nuclease of predicted toxin-antitoxin system